MTGRKAMHVQPVNLNKKIGQLGIVIKGGGSGHADGVYDLVLLQDAEWRHYRRPIRQPHQSKTTAATETTLVHSWRKRASHQTEAPRMKEENSMSKNEESNRKTS